MLIESRPVEVAKEISLLEIRVVVAITPLTVEVKTLPLTL